MGNTLDKRAYRRENHELFKAVIKHAYKKHAKTISQLQQLEENAAGIQVLIRKRPLFKKEAEKQEFDVIDAANSNILVHVCKSHADNKPIHSFVESRVVSFPKGTVYHESDTTEALYQEKVHPLVQDALQHGQRFTLFMFGQTGSGKTFTSSGILELFSKDFFSMLQNLDKTLGNWQVMIDSVELQYESIKDLIHDNAKITILESETEVNIQGVERKTISRPSYIVDMFKYVSSKRETAATSVNSTSSRSHFLFRVFVRHKSAPNVDYSRITFVDLAGSERNADSFNHNAERQQESAWINASLMALKDVIRIYSMNARTGKDQRIPFRAHKLTRLLKDSFTSDCKTMCIATISPNSTDTEHTLNTLTHMALLTGVEHEKENQLTVTTTAEECMEALKTLKESKQMKPMLKWTYPDVVQWVKTVRKGQFAKYAAKFPNTIDGKQLIRLTEQRLTQICKDQFAGAELREEIMKYNEAVRKQKADVAKENRDRF